jgi:hypothetical protein
VSHRSNAWTQTEDFVRLFRRVSELLNVHDPMGIGDPRPRAEEYDIEAGQITRLALGAGNDRAKVGAIVQDVFDAYFWPGRAARLDVVADEVCRATRELRLRRERREASRRELGAQALGWLIERLWLARGFEDALTAELLRGGWRAWTLADRDVSDARLAEYSTGGHVFSDGSVADQVARVAAVRLRRLAGWWIVPDPAAGPGDRFLDGVAHQAVADAVYYMERTHERSVIARLWQQAATATDRMGLVAQRGLASEHWNAFAEIVAGVELLVVGAYDGDGVIFVERAPTS